MLDIIRSAARVLMLILSGDLDPVPAKDAHEKPVPVPVVVNAEII